MTPLRLYSVCRETNRVLKHRDYPSEEHFKKYGLPTYQRYNREFSYNNRPTNEKARLCFLNDNLKWEEVSADRLKNLLS